MRQKVVIAFPNGGKVDSIFALSLLNLQKWEFENKCSEYELLEIFYTSGLYIEHNRNQIVRQARILKADWILQLDTDQSFEPELLRILMSTADKDKSPIIAGLYTNIGNISNDGKFEIVDCIYGEAPNGQYRCLSIPNKLQPFEIDAAGSGVLLTHISVFDKIESPWFWLGEFVNEDGSVQLMNEDIQFCRMAKQAGYKIFCNPMASVVHWKTIPLAPSNQRILQANADKFKESLIPDKKINLDIDGWMSEEELWWLYAQAKRFSEFGNGLVEIGCWKGRATFALCKGYTKGTVYAVDHFLGSETERETNHKEAKEGNIYSQFRENVGLFPNLKTFKCSSKEAVSQFPTKFVDMVFIDAGHEFEEVLEDINNWKNLCTKMLCGHDRDMEGVKKALEVSGLDYKEGAGSIWYVEL